MPITLQHPDALVDIDELQNGKRQLTVHLLEPSTFIPHTTWVTSYPLDLIELILHVKGPAYLCDEIMRDEDPAYVKTHLEKAILGYVDESQFACERILDFGCGSGASTMVLCSLFPKAEIVGIELGGDLLSIAKARAHYYGFHNVTFIQSPSGVELPEDIGTFDYVVLSGVYEHLLPHERKCLMPELWSMLRPGGVLFIDETPYRFFPIESHTTGLPIINYLPDRIALALSRRFSSKIAKDESWESLLKNGIRGGSVREIMNILHGYGKPMLLKPNRLGFRDRVDLWYEAYGSLSISKFSLIAKPLKFILKTIQLLTGITVLPYLSLAIKKNE
jgi:SAM-dependent methyltransferase